MDEQRTDQADEPVIINAKGPSDVAEPSVVTRHYDNNVEAADDKAAEALKAQTAPNPTTDAELARKAYGEDWNRRRGPAADRLKGTAHEQIATTQDGDAIYDHGGVAVDGQGHALGHSSDPEAAADVRETLVHEPEATDADRYPVTAEARQRDNES